MLYTTLNKIRAHSPCADGWRTLLCALGKTEPDDEVLSLAFVLESNGLDDALWCLRAIDGYETEIRGLARAYAADVLHLWSAPQVVTDYLKTGDESLRDAAGDATLDAAGDAARAAAARATRDAVRAARATLAATLAAAANAARAATWAAVRGAARDAAGDAAWAAAAHAARAAAWAAVRDAVRGARDVTWAAVRAAVRDAPRDAQKIKFVEFLNSVGD